MPKMPAGQVSKRPALAKTSPSLQQAAGLVRQRIKVPAYALLRIFSNACNVAASHLISPLPIAGQSLGSSLSFDF
jgi:hypothetical protein